MTWFNPNLLPESADPEGSTRYENVTIIHMIVPCRDSGTTMQLLNDDQLFVIYDCSPEYSKTALNTYKGTVIAESNGSYSWWKSITKEK
jgi:hypothetical protein